MAYTPPSSPCQHALLARSPIGHVADCPDCGVVHLSLDCVSVRLEAGAFLAMAEMVSEARQRLQGVPPREGQGRSEHARAVH